MAEQLLSPKFHRPAMILLVALWFGLATGLGEVAIRGVQKLLFQQLIFVSPDVAWMAPLADATILLAAGIVLYFLKWKWPRVISLRTAVFVFAFLAFVGPLLWFPRLHPYAGAILSIGLAAQTARMAAAHPDILAFLVRRTTGWMATLVVAMGLTLHGWQALAEYRAIKSLPLAPKDAPNVLFIVLDTVRAQSLSLYGYERPTTPNLERLAKRGVVFQHAIATAPWTLPSHASMFTGRFPHELSADWERPLDNTYPTLAEALSSRGYATSGFVANLRYCTYESGLDRGFAHYEDYPASWKTLNKSSWLARTITGHARFKKGAEEITSAFMRWLSQKDQRPFFAFLNYMDAHDPYVPPPPFDLRFASKRPRDPSLRNDHQHTQEEVERFKDTYDGAIAYLDYQVGSLLDEVEKRGLLNNTLVIITSDHGEQFGEHGLLGHGNSLYRPLLHVPLLISYPPHVPSGRRIYNPVTLADLPATVMEIVGLEGESYFPGNSLAHHWAQEQISTNSTRPLLSEVSRLIRRENWLPASQGNMKSLVDGRWHFILHEKLGTELYDWENDPQELHDLAEKPEIRAVLEQLSEIARRQAKRIGYVSQARDLP